MIVATILVAAYIGLVLWFYNGFCKPVPPPVRFVPVSPPPPKMAKLYLVKHLEIQNTSDGCGNLTNKE